MTAKIKKQGRKLCFYCACDRSDCCAVLFRLGDIVAVKADLRPFIECYLSIDNQNVYKLSVPISGCCAIGVIPLRFALGFGVPGAGASRSFVALAAGRHR